MKLFLVIFHNADQFMQLSSIILEILEEDNKLKSAWSLMLQNSFTVAVSDIFVLSEILFPISLKE